jgi:hypothetical protein
MLYLVRSCRCGNGELCFDKGYAAFSWLNTSPQSHQIGATPYRKLASKAIIHLITVIMPITQKNTTETPANTHGLQNSFAFFLPFI